MHWQLDSEFFRGVVSLVAPQIKNFEEVTLQPHLQHVATANLVDRLVWEVVQLGVL